MEKKQTTFLLRLSRTQKEMIAAKAKAAGLSLSAYLRTVGTGCNLPVPVPAINKSTYAELCRAGNTLKQIAQSLSAANTRSKTVSNEREITTLQEQLQKHHYLLLRVGKELYRR